MSGVRGGLKFILHGVGGGGRGSRRVSMFRGFFVGFLFWYFGLAIVICTVAPVTAAEEEGPPSKTV